MTINECNIRRTGQTHFNDSSTKKIGKQAMGNRIDDTIKLFDNWETKKNKDEMIIYFEIFFYYTCLVTHLIDMFLFYIFWQLFQLLTFWLFAFLQYTLLYLYCFWDNKSIIKALNWIELPLWNLQIIPPFYSVPSPLKRLKFHQ